MRTLTIYEESIACGLVANLTDACAEDGMPALPPASEAEKVRSAELARLTLNALTAGIVANCPVTVRPCSPRCVASAALWQRTDFGWSSGTDGWLSACGCGSVCGHSGALSIDMNGPVAEILQVRVGATTLAEEDYRLEGGRYLYRTDGTAWPTTQNMDLPVGSADTFAVTYRVGYPLGLAGELALGSLYIEWLKSGCGEKCRLPVGVTSINRNGVSMTINRSLFHDGLTGMRDVDTYVQSVNPYALRSVPTISSPDFHHHQVV